MFIGLLVAAVLDLDVVEANALEPERTAAIVRVVSEELSKRVGTEVSIHRCATDSSCGGPDAILVRLIVAPKKVRVTFSRGRRSSQLDLEREFTAESLWEPIRAAIAEIVPEAFAPVAPRPARSGPLGPWVVGGAGIALAVTGVVVGVDAGRATRELQSAGPTEVAEAASHADQSAIAANLLFAAAGLAVAAAIAWLAFH
ncbi:MAG: hypothetical protein HY791_16710 [Deltaproteobacteria bacterium]|nr:hypothetical protein [Deltaproteobacteria bacterium]